MLKLHLKRTLFFLFFLSYTSVFAQVTEEATYKTTNLQRLNLTISGEKWYYANDSTQQVYFFNANHTPWKTVDYPIEANKIVSLATINKPITQTTFKADELIELVWVFKDTLTQHERIKVLNELNDSVFILPEGNYVLTINELAGRPAKLFIENHESYDSYKTTIYSLPNMFFEKTYNNASNLHRQKFSYAGEVYYLKNTPQKRIEIYYPNHTLWKSIPLPVPSNGGSTYNYDPVFFADDKIFNADSLVEFAFSYDIGLGYGLSKIVSESGQILLPVNSNSSFVLNQKAGLLDKIFLAYNQSINTVNTQYHVIDLPYPTSRDYIYWFPVQRILFKNFGPKYINLGYRTLYLFNL